MTNFSGHGAYEQLVKHVYENGEMRTDRTGTGTYSVFGTRLEYDLLHGFPLITSKKTHFKSVLEELLWFLRGETNISTLNASIWDEWRRPYTEDRALTLVERRVAVPAPAYEGNYSFRGLNSSKGSVDGKLSSQWVKMMRRCYDPTHHRYALYGGRGVTVHPDWHDPLRYVEDVKQLPHWWYKQHDWNSFELDKDYYGSSQYGPNTSVWLSAEENNLYTQSVKPVTITRADGEQQHFLTQSIAAKNIGMPNSTFNRFLRQGVPTILKGNNKQYLGWEFAETIHADNMLARMELIADGDLGPIYSKQWRDFGGVDQIEGLINDIISDPSSRRLIVSAWNPPEIPDMALAPCHAMFQIYLRDYQYLDLQVYQRSADLLLGVPFNIASYALLVHILASITGYIPGKLTWIGGDTHLYINHLEQAEELIYQRSIPEFPRLTINRRIYSVDNIDPSIFELTNYNPNPVIKAPVAV